MFILNRGEGYTFIELLIAVTILALITAPLLTFFAAGFTAIRSAGEQTTAVNLGRAAMESVKAKGYTAAFEYYVSAGRSPLNASLSHGSGNFRLVTEVRPLSPETGPFLNSLELLYIRISVLWPGRDVERSVILESYLAPR